MKSSDESSFTRVIPQRPIDRLLGPVRRFLRIEAVSGLLLGLCAFLALALAASPLSHEVHQFWETEIAIHVGPLSLAATLHFFVNDILMTLFFLTVGLEIKREAVAGELRSFRKAALPILAALGGMIVPAIVYLLVVDAPGRNGWGIPTATDIAFAVGVLSLFGKRVPGGLKLFLLTLAIADDVGAILIIACFYGGAVEASWLVMAALAAITLGGYFRMGGRSPIVVVLLGVGLWSAVLKSGLHPTLAGVILGFLVPARARFQPARAGELLQEALTTFQRRTERGSEDHSDIWRGTDRIARGAVSPLERWEEKLHPWTAFVVMPLFALANAGIDIRDASPREPVVWAVVLGLVLGKPLGIFLFARAAIHFRLADWPRGVHAPLLVAAGCLGGIGFTMSLFVTTLALPPELHDAAKLGTLVGSFVSAVIGGLLLRQSLPR